jgi:hypothetical protein
MYEILRDSGILEDKLPSHPSVSKNDELVAQVCLDWIHFFDVSYYSFLVNTTINTCYILSLLKQTQFGPSVLSSGGH